MSDIVTLARRHKHVAPTHYEGCEVDHIGCLVNRLADEIEGLRAQLEERYILMRVRQLEHALDAERQTVRRQRAENERLRDALRWYSDLSNHLPVERRNPGDPDPAVIILDEPPILLDGGTLARIALEGKP